MILKLFVELNEINKTSTNITPCQETLGTLSNLHNVGYIISRIKIRVGKCSIPSRFDPPTLCCVVLCSYMYSANEKTVPGFNNTMVHSLWKSIKLVFQLMLLKAAMSPEVIKILMCGTSSHGFDSFMCNNDVTLSKTVTNPTLLNVRSRLIQSSRRLAPYDDSNYTILSYSKCMIYNSLFACIASVMKIYPMLTDKPKRVRCSHTKYNCMVLHDPSIKDICIDCGMDGPCFVVIRIEDKYRSFEHEQSTCLSKFLDSCNELPQVVESHLSSFMNSNKAINNTCNGVVVNSDIPIVPCRRHIMWSSITCPKRTYVISMVRSTLNFSSYRIRVDQSVRAKYEASVRQVRNTAYQLRKFNSIELRVLHDDMSPCYISLIY